MNWGEFIGPAVVAAVVSGLISFVGMLVNRATTVQVHRERLEADQDLAERKFAFDKELTQQRFTADRDLAHRKLELDRAMADWKRRTDLAEIVLADFYKARDIFSAARMPFAFAGEGNSRPRHDGESESEASHRDAIYAPFERLSRERDFLSELHARRFRFMALFGAEAAHPFQVFIQSFNQIATATRALISDRPHLRDDQRNNFESMIGWVLSGDDPIAVPIDNAVREMELICRRALDVTPS
ncbi:MAG: hypothetical protein KDJ20_07665 [Hyphomicrobiales bacterium]|nr:hypothetical protein [Hyphomicrobiales bacterium]MCC2109071.1 hypothetical protein [Hyphomicrobiales bacterium]